MITREITEIKCYILFLNRMTGNYENITPVAISHEPESLINWYNEQCAHSPYNEDGPPSFECHGNSHTWIKSFKKGSPLEWFNPCLNITYICEEYDGNDGIKTYWLREEQLDHAKTEIGVFI